MHILNAHILPVIHCYLLKPLFKILFIIDKKRLEYYAYQTMGLNLSPKEVHHSNHVDLCALHAGMQLTC